MSRARSSSSASGSSARDASKAHPLTVKIFRLAQPSLLIAHDYKNPKLPPLPQAELLLPKQTQQAYVGEEYAAIISIQLAGYDPLAISIPRERKNEDSDGSKELAKSAGPEPEASTTYEAFLRIELEAPDRSRIELLSWQIADATYAAEKILFELTNPGIWIIRVSVRYNIGAEEAVLRRTFEVEARPTISVRTKISKGSSALCAHVMEAQVENLSDCALVIESCALNTMNGWEATVPTVKTTDEESTETTGGMTVLRPRDVHQWSFVLRGGWAPEAGPLAVGWRREPLGAKGWQVTGSIRI